MCRPIEKMMTKVLQNPTRMNENIQDNVGSSQSNRNYGNSTLDVSVRNSDDNSQDQSDLDDSEHEMPKQVKRRVQKFCDSDSDVGEQNEEAELISQTLSHKNNDRIDYSKGLPRKTSRICNKSSSDSDSDLEKKSVSQIKDRRTALKSNDIGSESSIKSVLSFPKQIHRKFSSDSDLSDMPKSPKSMIGDVPILKSISRRSRLKRINTDSSSDSDQAVKNEQQQIRTKNKQDMMKDRFKSLITSRGKGRPTKEVSDKSSNDSSEDEANICRPTKEESDKSSNDSSEDEAKSSMEKLKQKIKERMSSIPTLYDPDTSDDETANKIQQNSLKSMPKQNKERKTKLTSPKPQRMSAKQAMENMQKIKSESNRMLREKEVSLPYHRPKALSLKDIMSRRKPALSSDGKSLPIKMNGEQLKRYAQMLEDRQKQMMDLWKSDTDDDDNDEEIKSGDKNCERTISDKTTEDLMSSSVPILSTADLTRNETDNLAPAILHKCESNESNADISADNDKIFDILSQSNIGKEVQSTIINEEEMSETNMKLVFNVSETSMAEEILVQDKCNVIEDASTNNSSAISEKTLVTASNAVGDKNTESQDSSIVPNTETDSQLISLHYDTGSEIQANDHQVLIDTTVKGSNTENITLQREDVCEENITEPSITTGIEIDEEIKAMDIDGFSDDDMNIEDIDNIVENAEIIRDIEDKLNSQVLFRDIKLNIKPKLTGAPGMVIDLDSITAPKKSGVELLKERFTFFAKLKTPEELEREKEKRIKPGRQHLILKQELEEQMAEQRSIEWAKRLHEEKQQQNELKELTREDDDEDDIDKLEEKLNEAEKNEDYAVSEAESEEELVENDIDMSDKPKAKNPMLDEEAEESDGDDENGVEQKDGDEDEGDNENDKDDEESSDSSSESEAEDQPTVKKSRILKAFEDSDDEETTVVGTENEETEKKSNGSEHLLGTQPASQDDMLTLAQRARTASEDLFTSQDSSLVSQAVKSQALPESLENDVDLGTQTFSILDSTNNKTTDLLNTSDKIKDLCEKHNFVNLDAIAMCSGSLSQTFPSLPITQTTQSQTIGEDILALCTGKFYDNEFVTQVNENNQLPLGASQDYDSDVDDSQYVDKVETQTTKDDIAKESQSNTDVNTDIVAGKVNIVTEKDGNKSSDIEILNKENKINKVDDNLRSILDELDDPEFDSPKPNEFFCGGSTRKADLKEQDSQIKKKFTIDSDDDEDEVKDNENESKKQKKLKKRKPEKRALQISDDEDESEQEEIEEYESEIEEETTERERLVEYDSEENEIVVQPLTGKPSKKKRKGTDFFEQEAELTSEDEWVGSGDEDEAGLDRMEREEGDDETFHQGRLQRELGQIHMRDVLDQDKREVRIIQELLFEDGDLGGGGRQRKFKWKNLDGDEDTGSGVNEFGESQEEEFESEEQWRKQRHEREMFLRQMQNTSKHDESLNVSVDRTTIIKANLMGRTVSMVLDDNKPAEKTDSPIVVGKSMSPKKPFSILQHSYQGSILNRGTGALARLAALATPLAVDHDAPKGKSAAQGSGRNFVFAALTPDAPKATKRKAEANPSTPKLVKKMKSEEKRNMCKSSLLDSI